VKCPHGVEIGLQALPSEEEDDATLEFYTACDCCDFLMHKSYAGESYTVLEDGQTLCSECHPIKI
jgi:hypothetical protein